MRLMAYNIEWFDEHFTDDNGLKNSPESNRRFDGITNVIETINPDLIGITEAPNTTTTTGQRDTVKALENFAAAKNLRQSKALIGFPSAGRQEIAVLYDPTKLEAIHDPGGKAGRLTNPPFNEYFHIDSDGDNIREVYRHYRPPLEVKVKRADGGDPFWVIVVHAKSKGIFSAMDRVNFDRASERNRRKLFAECSSIRQRVDDWLKLDRATVVMGDINDGPGFDYYESRFGRSAVELIMGRVFEPDNILHYHVGEPKFGRFGWEPSTARFRDNFTGDLVNVLIDHVMASRHLQTMGEQPGKVWNPFQLDEAKAMKQALLDGSDHFPVTLDVH